jgi:soluble lytic murein transglycosylase
MRGEAEVRLALRRDDPEAPALFHALPGPLQADPGLVIELARWYRRAGLDRDAAAVWTGPGVAAEAAAPAERRQAFWDERNLVARRLLRGTDPALAYAVVAAPAASAEGAIDQAFLAGWIALRRLDDPATAIKHFTVLAGLSGSAITQGRAHYWLGRALLAAGQADQARAEFDAAAAWPTTYYGQLAALARGDGAAAVMAHVAAAQDPHWTDQRATAFLAQDTARAAVLLAAWGEAWRAKPFLARLDDLAKDPAERAMAARLAVGLGLPDEAVAIARRAGRDGVMLPGAGWPAPVSPPIASTGSDVEQAVVLGLIRQESSFDAQALSPAGARGLMQLMPATAAAVARKIGVAIDPAALTEAGYNMRLGTSYLGGLLARFNQSLPLAIAGYNAGPSRVQDWLAAMDPAGGADGMIDWIELIPFNETRNYVQRVIENIEVYRAQLGVVAAHPVEPVGVPG